jgi:hypothetical protein
MQDFNTPRTMSIISDNASVIQHMTHTYKCQACGTDWTDHRGPISLCERIQECKRIIADLLTFVEQPNYSRDIGEMESYFDTIEDAEIILKEF